MFFFFKQKTAYEMRISDWSSDVCSSDLTALVQLQRRTDHDDRTARVVDALAEQVLAETTLLALDHVGKRFQRALVGASDRTAATAVVDQRVDRFLQHALFIAHDDVRRRQFEQALETIVTVDDAAIQIVEIRGREAATVERHQGGTEEHTSELQSPRR